MPLTDVTLQPKATNWRTWCCLRLSGAYPMVEELREIGGTTRGVGEQVADAVASSSAGSATSVSRFVRVDDVSLNRASIGRRSPRLLHVRNG
jgi:hypothetical protein